MRLGLLPTLSTAYEGMPDDLRGRKLDEARRAASSLERELGDEVVLAGPAATPEEGAAAADELRRADVYALVVLPTIATMAATPWAAVSALDVPTVIWSRSEPGPEARGPQELVYASAPVGATAIGNVLARHGRPYRCAAGPEPSQRSLDFLRGARLARAARSAVLAHFGGTIWPGMLDVTLDRERLAAALGIRIVDLEPDWSAAPATLGDLDVDGVDAAALARSRALAGAIAGACARAGALGGSIHCHGEAFATNPDVGVVGCLAASVLSAGDVPLACTGDDCTAVALWLASQLAGAAQYLELDAPHERLDACLVSSGGEGDLRLARRDVPARVCPNRFFSGTAGRGAALDFALAPGPVTLIAFTPIGETFRVIAAEGAVLDEAPGPLGMPRAYVGFARPAREAFEWWCEAGANHHLALAPGHHAEPLRACAEALAIEAELLAA